MFDLNNWLAEQLGVTPQDHTRMPAIDMNLRAADSRCEFVLTNGLGSFASGDALSGANTRRYHGLFVASLQPPVRRTLLLSHIDEKATVDGVATELATNIWRGAVAPEGFRVLTGFTVYPVPTWQYTLNGGVLIKQVAMIPGKQQVVTGYSWVSESGKPLKLDLTVVANNRDMHGETRGWNDWKFQQNAGDHRVSVKGWNEAQELVLRFNAGEFRPDPAWHWGYEWPREFERGLNDSEDCFRIGTIEVTINSGEAVSLVAELGGQDATRVEPGIATIGDAVRRVYQHQQKLLADAGQPTDPYLRQLVLAADQFLVHRDSVGGATVIAGYHWFGDWGRDSMISLTGLTLATGRYEEAKSILETFGRYVSEGMLPNYFPDGGQAPEYNTSDATLWWAFALNHYFQATGDMEFVRKQLPLLDSVVEWHRKGTRHKLHLDQSDGLVAGGEAGVQLTWMDAKVGDLVVTPRQGKAVEICALWYNFLRCLSSLYEKSAAQGGLADADEAHRKAVEYGEMAATTHAGMAKFWNADKGCLYDVILDGGGVDASVRPNQLIALSLPFVAFTPQQGREILAVVEKELLTPLGMRTLSPSDPAYRGQYGGGHAQANQYERDITYHQGTVWPWLLGPWVDARLFAHGETQENVAFILSQLDTIMKHILGDAGLGSVSEIFDGDAPHTARGCVAQAWSVAELLRTRKRLLELQASKAPQAVAAL
jgi:predicted glycogen debranching enzyme